jgi:hypothetical protein
VHVQADAVQHLALGGQALRGLQREPQIVREPPRHRGAGAASAARRGTYRDARSLSTILLAAAPEELFC